VLLGCYVNYDEGMRTVGTAAAIGLATGIVGSVAGLFLVMVLLDRLAESAPLEVLNLRPSPLSRCGLRGRHLRYCAFEAPWKNTVAYNPEYTDI
jgi:hypothetical protein